MITFFFGIITGAALIVGLVCWNEHAERQEMLRHDRMQRERIFTNARWRS